MRMFSAIRRRRKWLVGGGLALVAALAVATSAVRSLSRSEDDSRPVFEVQRGPLTISVGVSGTIKALDQEVITNEVEGQTTILYIIPEGQHVEQGDLLVELDSSKLQDSLVDQEIKTQNAEASFINARENLEVVKNQAQSDVDKAELAYRFAKEDREKFLDGDFPLQAKEAEAKVTLARGDTKRAQDKLEGSRKLATNNFITSMELEADEQSALKAQLDLQMAEERVKLLNDFEYKRQLAQLESDEDQARMALDRVKRKAAADVVQAEADLKAKELESEREKGKLEKLHRELEKTKLYASRAGLVVYATTGRRGGFRGNEEPLAEGQSVRERQELIYLPTTNAYKAEVKVHESSLAKVQPGLPVTLSVEALPGRTFEGLVETIAPLPDAQSVWLNPDLKVYNTDIRITGDTEGLHTGMSCKGEILVKEFEDTLYVPVQAVVRESGVPTVYLADGAKVERRKVALGLDNNRMVQIEDGLQRGEMVLLAPPLGADEMQTRASSQRRNAAGAGPAEASGAAQDTPRSPEPGAEPARAQEVPGPAPAADGASTAAPEGAAPPAAGDAGGEDRRARFRDASPEERERMRQEWQKRMENMTPEEREQMQQRRQRPREDGGRGEGRRQGRGEGGDEGQRRPE